MPISSRTIGRRAALALLPAAALAMPLVAQAPAAGTSPAASAMIARIRAEGMDSSRVARLLQSLTDSVGPRLTGSPGHRAGNRWLLDRYREYGIPARDERYGTWRAWRRGAAHVDLVRPRVRSLEATMLAWSGSTGGRAVEGAVVMLPEVADSAAFARWLPTARGKVVLLSMAQPSCRPDDNARQWYTPASFERLTAERQQATAAWNRRLARAVSGAGDSATAAAAARASRELPRRLEQAGAIGLLTSLWSQGWGVDKIFQARAERVPTFDVSCEDYGLLFRLAQNGQGPVVRLAADAESLGEQPVHNTVAEIRGSQKPDEYVMLSAHFDSWDGASGATDNATGTVVMLEAMRILRKLYPQPKRTIIVGHWGGEEQGLNGSRGLAADRPEVTRGLQALFNQDNGTGRIGTISMQGLTGAQPYFQRWLAAMPSEITGGIQLVAPGSPGGGGSDYASFICAGAPAFNLSSMSYDYGTYTWHTNRDTYDKVNVDDVKANATLVAMLAYLAAEEPERLPRDRVTPLPANPRTGEPTAWPTCAGPTRTSGESTR